MGDGCTFLKWDVFVATLTHPFSDPLGSVFEMSPYTRLSKTLQFSQDNCSSGACDNMHGLGGCWAPLGVYDSPEKCQHRVSSCASRRLPVNPVDGAERVDRSCVPICVYNMQVRQSLAAENGTDPLYCSAAADYGRPSLYLDQIPYIAYHRAPS